MSMTLAEFEALCLSGPLESVTPDMMSKAYSVLDGVIAEYMRRMEAHRAQFIRPAKRRGGFSGPVTAREIEWHRQHPSASVRRAVKAVDAMRAEVFAPVINRAFDCFIEKSLPTGDKEVLQNV